MQDKRVLIVGGTGFLGWHATREFLKKGWRVTGVGLPPGPPAGLFPEPVEIKLANMDETPDEELRLMLAGQEALVFAAGMDDRVPLTRPAYPKLHRANVESCRRLLTLAQEAGVRRAVVLGSYFAHFNRLWPELKLVEHHPYIRSRVEQEALAAEFSRMDVCMLELPYIFGDPLGKRPLWHPLVKYLRAMPIVFYPKGGSACVTAETVGGAIAAAAERGRAGQCYPIGDENLTWTELLQRLAAADGRRVQVVTLPTGLVRLGLAGVWLAHRLQGKESGLDPHSFADLQTRETFIDPEPSRQELGYTTGGLEEAFRKTVKACN